MNAVFALYLFMTYVNQSAIVKSKIKLRTIMNKPTYKERKRAKAVDSYNISERVIWRQKIKKTYKTVGDIQFSLGFFI